MGLLPPTSRGYLPHFMLLTSALALVNTVGNYVSQPWSATQQIYGNMPVTPLQGRLFGTWTLVVFATRPFAAYDITNRGQFLAALGGILAADWHWALEWLVYETTPWEGVRTSVILDGLMTVWMLLALAMGWYAPERKMGKSKR